MRRSCLALHLTAALLLSSPFHLAHATPAASAATPLVIGESFSIDSQALQEQRHINVYQARAWDTPPDAPLRGAGTLCDVRCWREPVRFLQVPAGAR